MAMLDDVGRDLDAWLTPFLAVLVIDDTALPKKGALSVGVAPQYCGQLGNWASGRTAKRWFL